MLHGRVTAAHRATAVSAMSLAMALGGIAGNLVIPVLATAVSVDAAFLLVGVVVLLSAAACLRLPRTPADDSDEPPAGEEGLAGSGSRNAGDTRPH